MFKDKSKNDVLLLITVILLIVIYIIYSKNKTPTKITTNFQECIDAGNIVMETYPRQCKTKDGQTFMEEIPEKITYNNAWADLIKVDLPFPGAVVGKDFSVIGQARGTWFFEASFPVEVIDKDGNLLFIGPAQAQSEWMTEDFVPFKLDIKIVSSYIGPATLIIKKDNPSGLVQYNASISFPINIEY